MSSNPEYEQALAGEGEYWDNFVAQRLLRGEIPGSIDWRLTFSQFRYNHGWRPLALGPQLITFRLPQIRDILVTAAPEPGKRILDLGCGAGWLSLELARRGAHVTALDISPTNLALGRYMAETNTRNFPYLYQRFAGLPCRLEDFGSVEYAYADLNNVDLPTSEYDAVVVWDSLHHVSELETLLEQVRGALKPGGVFIGVDHSFATPLTGEFNGQVLPYVKDFYEWVSDTDPEWLYDSVIALGRQSDLGVLSVDYDPTLLPGFGPFAEELLHEMLDIFRGKEQSRIQENEPDERADEESPFEDVSAQRLLFSLADRFEARRFHTICPMIEPEIHIPHYRHEKERIFQHYMAAMLVRLGERAINYRQADGQWFFFELTAERPSPESLKPSISTEDIHTYVANLEAHIDHKNAALSDLEMEMARKNAAIADLEGRLAEALRPRWFRLPRLRR
ncbi:MAG TPA: class I SAM-dependent methyltransferase [Chloroflexia bacterium]|nr:class I SAM-dependent methyltransferase [Chloroflexia bacterium]